MSTTAIAPTSTTFTIEPRGHGAITDLGGVPVVVHVEQLGRQRVAAVVPLALLGLDPHAQREPPFPETSSSPTSIRTG